MAQSGHEVVLSFSFLMFLGGFGLLAVDYYYDTNILDTFDKMAIAIIIGLIGLVLSVKIIQQYGMFMTFTKHHFFGFIILIIIGIVYAYSQGWLEWML